MNQEERIAFLVDLFHAIDIREKGIEYIYDILLQKQSVDDIKEFVDIGGITLKRAYKVIQILEKLGLIQVYNRPMIVNLKDPINSWEELISEKVKEIKLEADKKIEGCELSFQNFLDAYNLKTEKISVPPVEFISVNPSDYDPKFFESDIIGDAKILKFVKGDVIKTPFMEDLKRLLIALSEKDEKTLNNLITFCKNWKEALPVNLPKESLEILLTEDYVKSITEFEKLHDFRLLEDQLKMHIQLPPMQIKVSSKVLTNFLLRDNKELIQYSTSPDNALIGLFISRQREIYDIFAEKYQHEFNQAENLEKYFIEKLNRPVTLLEIFIFTLM